MTPRKLVEKWMPSAERVRGNKHLACFGKLLHDRALWHIGRHTLAKAFLVGMFCAMLPIPFQMVVAAAGAIMLHGNLPVAVGLVWLTNPLTMPPVFYGAYKFGAWLLGMPEQNFQFEASMEWAMHGMLMIWQPFLLGCLVLGLVLGGGSFVCIHLLWRWMVTRRWQQRHSPVSLGKD